jgi:hypothetical protein
VGLRSALLSKADSRATAGLVKDSVLALQEDIAKDAKGQPGVLLDTAVAIAATVLRIVDVAARHSVLCSANDKRERRQAGAAREDIDALTGVVLRAADLAIVRAHDRWRKEEQCGASIGNALNACRMGCAPDCIASSGELPEAIGSIDRRVGN